MGNVKEAAYDESPLLLSFGKQCARSWTEICLDFRQSRIIGIEDPREMFDSAESVI